MNLIITSIILVLANEGQSAACDGGDKGLYNTNNNKINFFQECASASKPCVVKCCAMGEVIRFLKKTHTCKSIEQLYKEINFTEEDKNKIRTYSDLKIRKADGSNSQKAFFEDFTILYEKSFGTFFYHEYYTIFTEDGNAEFNQTDDSITFEMKTVRPPNFCVGIVVATKKKIPALSYRYFPKLENICLKNIKAKILSNGYFLSAFFSFLTLVVYGLLEPLRTKLHNLLFMGFISSHMVFAVLFAYQILILYFVYRDDDAYKRMDVCKWTAPITYYFLLSTFFWMNTMAFDIWRTFRALKKVNYEIRRRSTYKKLCYYSLYAWGMPAIITAVAVGIDLSDLPTSVHKPRFEICHPDDTSNLVSRLYNQLPIAFVVVTNIGFFLRTVFNIWSSGQPILKLKADSSKHKKNSQIIIFIKLSVIMGISWVLELVQAPARERLPIWSYVLLNLFNTCLGVVLFFVMVFKRSVFIMLCQRFKIENRWTRRSAQSKKSTRTQESTLSKSVSRTRSIDNTMDSEVSNADAPKRNQDPLQKARFTISTQPDPV